MTRTPPAPPTASDDEALRALMVRYQRGEFEAFEELYGRTLPMIRGYLAALAPDRTQALDLAQECYLQIHRSRHTYDPAFPVRPWMLGIARHVRLMDHRSRGRRRAWEVVGLDGVPEVPVPAEVEHLYDRDTVERALAGLPADWREALALRHVYGLSFREIGGVVGVSEGGARIRACRGMAALRDALTSGKHRG